MKYGLTVKAKSNMVETNYSENGTDNSNVGGSGNYSMIESDYNNIKSAMGSTKNVDNEQDRGTIRV